jgi:hypothetical protein
MEDFLSHQTQAKGVHEHIFHNANGNTNRVWDRTGPTMFASIQSSTALCYRWFITAMKEQVYVA